LQVWLASIVPAAQFLIQVLGIAVSFGLTTLLFALIFKFLPDGYIRWQDVGVGAVVTALLFTIGQFALSLYLGNSSMTSVYGAAGSFMVILLWVFYSAQIVLFGAEFTQVYARRYGAHIVSDNDEPSEKEKLKEEDQKSQQESLAAT
jgi:membrane protein